MSIELIIGPMTHLQAESLQKSYLLEREIFGRAALIINFHPAEIVDVGVMVCPDRTTLPCLCTAKLMDVQATFDSVYIHNAHLFPDLKEFVLSQNHLGRNVLVYAADSDHKQAKLGQVWDILPFAHHITKPLLVCANPKCLKFATCSMMLESRYIAVCPQCHR
jgi:hypothetical protein